MEQMLTGRKQLQNLEDEDRYVFHGSENSDLDYLEPRQAYNYRDDNLEPDGDPAVFASSRVDYAILLALVNKKNCPHGCHSSASSTQKENGEVVLKLGMSRDSSEQLDGKSFGYVYVFDRNLFQKRDHGGVEYMSKIPVSALSKIRVTKTDLPLDVEVFEN